MTKRFSARGAARRPIPRSVMRSASPLSIQRRSICLFERFVSAERKEPPDIDVDFEHERREEVIQDIYRRYGHERAGIDATVITYRAAKRHPRSGQSVRTLRGHHGGSAGDGLGLVARRTSRERLCPRRRRSIPDRSAICGCALDLRQGTDRLSAPSSPAYRRLCLTRDRLDSIVPIGNAAMEDRNLIEWDKDDIDALGIMKVDVLALGMLTCIRKAFELLQQHYGIEQEFGYDPAGDDAAVYDMLCKADPIGVFQVESRAQMNMLPRLRPREFLRSRHRGGDRAARPDPGRHGASLSAPRRSGSEPVESAERGTARTSCWLQNLGVPLFQEQAMQHCHRRRRNSRPEEANGLRRAMATFRHVGTHRHAFATR